MHKHIQIIVTINFYFYIYRKSKGEGGVTKYGKMRMNEEANKKNVSYRDESG